MPRAHHGCSGRAQDPKGKRCHGRGMRYPAWQGDIEKLPPKSHRSFFSSYSAAWPPHAPHPTTFRVLALLALRVAVPSCSPLGPWSHSLLPSLAAPQTPRRAEPALQNASRGLQPHCWAWHRGQLSLQISGGCTGPLGVSGPTPRASFDVRSGPKSELRLRALVGCFWISPRISKEFPGLFGVLLAK